MTYETSNQLESKKYRKCIGLAVDASNFHGVWDDIIEKIKIADELGYNTIWLGESWGYELFSSMSEVVHATKHIHIGAGIANVYSRTPGLIASAIATLDERSHGRIKLGLGPSGSNVVEHWHGVKFEKPVKRTREYVEIIRMILRGEKLTYQGDIFQLTRGFKLRFEPFRKDIPIYIAAMGPKNILQTGEIADGILPIFWSGHKWPELRTQLDEGAQKAGRPAHSSVIAPYIPTVILKENLDSFQIKQARLAASAPLAYHIGKMGIYYAEILKQHGFEEDVQEVLDGWKYGMEAATKAVSSSMLDAVTIVGTPQEVVKKLDQWATNGVDEPILTMPEGTVEEVATQLGTLMEAIRS